ncbi:hypothetical protein ACHAPT_010838 [Fusarium lateritium]
MAIDVLNGRQHIYRYDLESFLYVFLWIAICGGPNELPAESRLWRWMGGSWDDLAVRKVEDMEYRGFVAIVEEFAPQFRGLEKLAYLLHHVLFGERRWEEDEDAERLYAEFFWAIEFESNP